MINKVYDTQFLADKYKRDCVRTVFIALVVMILIIGFGVIAKIETFSYLVAGMLPAALAALICRYYKISSARDRQLSIDKAGQLTLTGTGLTGKPVNADCKQVYKIREFTTRGVPMLWINFTRHKPLIFSAEEFSDENAIPAITDVIKQHANLLG